jgi:hypothetical protein
MPASRRSIGLIKWAEAHASITSKKPYRVVSSSALP